MERRKKGDLFMDSDIYKLGEQYIKVYCKYLKKCEELYDDILSIHSPVLGKIGQSSSMKNNSDEMITKYINMDSLIKRKFVVRKVLDDMFLSAEEEALMIRSFLNPLDIGMLRDMNFLELRYMLIEQVLIELLGKELFAMSLK